MNSFLHHSFFTVGYSHFTMFCQFLLFSQVNQLYTYTHRLPLGLPPYLTPIPSIQVTPEHQAELAVLHSGLSPAICFTHGRACMWIPLSQFIPPNCCVHASIFIQHSFSLFTFILLTTISSTHNCFRQHSALEVEWWTRQTGPSSQKVAHTWEETINRKTKHWITLNFRLAIRRDFLKDQRCQLLGQTLSGSKDFLPPLPTAVSPVPRTVPEA